MALNELTTPEFMYQTVQAQGLKLQIIEKLTSTVFKHEVEEVETMLAELKDLLKEIYSSEEPQCS